MGVDRNEVFLSLWESGNGVPDVFSFLEEQDDLQVADRLAIVLLDQRQRWRTKAPLRVEDYLQGLPDLASDPECKLQLAMGEFEARHNGDTWPRVDEFTSRFSDLGDVLRAKLSHLASESHGDDATDNPTDLAESMESLLAEVIEAENRGAPIDREVLLAAHPNHADSLREFFAIHDELKSAVKNDDTVGAKFGSNGPSNAELQIQLISQGRYRLIRILGEGAFGRVYLAIDEELQRQVAVKVPRTERFQKPADADAYLAEARMVAKLDHQNIVPVFDLGRTADGSIYVVSKFIQGRSLEDVISDQRPDAETSAKLMATVAAALDHAHQCGLIHRDVKPGNILIEDPGGKPYITDFGLAIHEDDYPRSSRIAGTPGYMSPEQVRGEGHRLDARSDVFSLGVVLYLLLTGKRAFRGSTSNELMHQVISAEPTPPRQLDDSIPVELERICLKALAKRASDRYNSAAELADDLLHWQPGSDHSPAVPPIEPRGLRSFGAEDAEFFLDLLPGPRGRTGLPESVQFWKQRIEQHDADQTFSVGLIYGPSGCGKSSFVCAGLLPRLSDDVIAVYIEATPDETQRRILRGVRKRVPEAAENLGLVETLANLRRKSGRKVVLVLDQFEQWLHAHRAEQDTELVAALRQCDGGRLQAIVMVRDDFWLATSRFMNDLEVELVPGQNIALVDLFDTEHAQRVLAKFGQAFGKLPARASQFSDQEQEFIRSAATGLARDGKVVPVRLSLFAEMVKNKPWVPATLQAVGGTVGVGFNFLEETFSSRSGNPKHRLHQRAAREVLKALLPEVGIDIKGHMQSHAELLERSGYAARPSEFNELLRILDGELRLITPTDPEGFQTESASDPSAKFYQLTHDYLVPSLREWLTRKQQETRKGRAELKLDERTALWAASPRNRYLPSFPEWARIAALTDRGKWTAPQQSMMDRARRVYGVRTVGTSLVLAIFGWVGFEAYGFVRGSALVESLKTTEIDGVPSIAKELIGYRRWTGDDLHDLASPASGDANTRLHASLALLPTDASQLEYLKGRLLDVGPDQIETVRSMLASHQDALVDDLWRVAQSGSPDHVLRAASVLAAYDVHNTGQWSVVADGVADALVKENPLRVAVWMQTLRPARRYLLNPLGQVYRDAAGDRSQTQIDLATDLLKEYAADNLDVLAELLFEGEVNQFASLYPEFSAHDHRALAKLKQELARELPDLDETDPAISDEDREALARRQANVAVAAVRINQADLVWPLLRHRVDPRLRTWIIHRLSALGASPETIVTRLGAETDVSARRALILSLGKYDETAPIDRAALSSAFLELYRDDPDPGVHSAAEWVLRRWGKESELSAIDRPLSIGMPEPERGWYMTKWGQTMAVIPGPTEFRMGSPSTEKDRHPDEVRHRRRIGRTYAIGTKEVTVRQFQEFLSQNPDIHHKYNPRYSPDEDCPQTYVTWYAATAYCRWLSEQEGLAEDQMCYPQVERIGEGMDLPADYLSRTGYRLPSEAEWEYAGRSGAATSYGYGETTSLLAEYGWYSATSHDRSWPVATLKPNEFGLFDMHGNVWEWCQSRLTEYRPNALSEDQEDTVRLSNSDRRVIRGGGHNSTAPDLRSAFRYVALPLRENFAIGFRICRTMPVSP